MKMYEANIEYKMPTISTARIRIEEAFRFAKSQKYDMIKFIHGYGSSGKGGAIKRDLKLLLLEMSTKGLIKTFVCGEDFSPFSDSSRKALCLFPSLKKDKDYAKGNMGITIVLLK